MRETGTGSRSGGLSSARVIARNKSGIGAFVESCGAIGTRGATGAATDCDDNTDCETAAAVAAATDVGILFTGNAVAGYVIGTETAGRGIEGTV